MCAFFANDLTHPDNLERLLRWVDSDAVYMSFLDQSGPIPPDVAESFAAVWVEEEFEPWSQVPYPPPLPGTGFAAPCNTFTTTATARLRSILTALEAPTWTPTLRRSVNVALHNLALEATHWVYKDVVSQPERLWMGLLVRTQYRVSVQFANIDFTDSEKWNHFVRITSFVLGRLADAAARCVDPAPVDVFRFRTSVFKATAHPGVFSLAHAHTPEEVDFAWMDVWSLVHRSVAPLLLSTLHSELRTQHDWTHARAIFRELVEIADGPRPDAPVKETARRVAKLTHAFVIEYAGLSTYWTRPAGASAINTRSGDIEDEDEGFYDEYPSSSGDDDSDDNDDNDNDDDKDDNNDENDNE